MSEVLDQLDVQQQEVINPAQESEQVQPEQAQPEPVQPPQEDIQEKNWKAARNRMDEQTHQIRMLQQELELVRKYSKPEEKVPDEEEFLTDSEKKLYREIKSLKQEVYQSKVKDTDYVVDRLRAKFKDFDDVMNPENISHLKTNNPSLAKALASLKDEPYEQGLAAYDALKNTSWYLNRHVNEDKARMEQNLKKPGSVQSVRKQGALSEANRFVNGLTPELKKQLNQEMANARKGG